MANSDGTSFRVKPADDISQVLARLGEILDWSADRSSRLGYFPALYRKVTFRVEEGISAGVFDDGPRMERLDVIFANRYLQAFDQQLSQAPPTHAWGYAFRASRQWWPIVLQHLLLGINAHINLDLGIAAAQTVAAPQLPSLKSDFFRINQILASLVAEVQSELEQIWVPYRLLNRLLGRADSALINFSMEKARDQAWRVALRLGPMVPEAREYEIRKLDSKVLALAFLVRNPGIKAAAATRLIRLCERESVARTIEILK